MINAPLGTISVTFIFIGLIYILKRSDYRLSLPPGPKPIPFIGNILELKSKELWLRVTQLGQEYGDIVCLHFFGRKIVYLNTAEAALDLLDKRGSIYSDKPRMVMAGELCGCNRILPFTNYGDKFRRQRKLMQTSLGNKEIPNYHQWLHRQTQTFIRHLVESPSDYTNHIRRYAGGLTLALVYGYHVAASNDEYLLLAEECLDLLSNRISGGGMWLVDIFPFLKAIPSWLPGAGFKREAEEFRRKYERFAEGPYRFAKLASKTMDAEGIRSFCATFLREEGSESFTEEMDNDIKWTANSMYAASADTTIATVCHFILAMIDHPDVFEKAQKEIDEVVLRGRLPTFADRKSLPYVECIFMETLRWGVPVPLNLPHNVREDDVYRGMSIPKNSMVIANIWAIMRDESLYTDAHSFKPERFMTAVDITTERKLNPSNYAFGFGRRRCPGADLVDSSIWLLIASMVAALRITTPDRTTVSPKVLYNNAFFRIPSSFEFRVELREGYHLDQVNSGVDNH